MPPRWERVRRTKKGTFRLDIPKEERFVLSRLPDELRELFASDDPTLERLFPPAHPDDPEQQERFRELVSEQLMTDRLAALRTMEETLEKPEIDEEQLTAWLTTINDLRLVLGLRLEVTQDLDLEAIPDTHLDARTYALYGYLGWLESQIVDALAEGLEEPGD